MVGVGEDDLPAVQDRRVDAEIFIDRFDAGADRLGGGGEEGFVLGLHQVGHPDRVLFRHPLSSSWI